MHQTEMSGYKGTVAECRKLGWRCDVAEAGPEPAGGQSADGGAVSRQGRYRNVQALPGQERLGNRKDTTW